MMGQGRRGHAGPVLDFADCQPSATRANQHEQHLKAGFGADGGKALGSFLRGDVVLI